MNTHRKSLLALSIATAITAQNARALSFDLSDEVVLDWDTSLSYSAAWRTGSQHDDFLSNDNINGDDGNRNFDKGAMINNRFSVLSEMDLQYRDFGAFLRGSAFYDGAYFGETDNDSPATFNGNGDYNRFSDDVKSAHGKDARVLDAFVYGSFDVTERTLDVRVGRQVVSWGESLFIPGISSAMSPADATKNTVPGVEVKDILLPVGQVFAQLDLTSNLSVAAYSQWEWGKNEVSEAGSYFGPSDTLDEAGDSILLTDEQLAAITQLLPTLQSVTISRGKDIEAKDTGQWGAALNYYAENLGNGTDFGVYYLNYHDKNPSIIQGERTLGDYIQNPGFDPLQPIGPTNPPVLPTTASQSYHTEFVEDIRLTGLSFSTLIGDTNVAGEIAYRQDTIVNLAGSYDSTDDILLGDTVQAQLSVIHSFGASALADEVVFTGEAGYIEILKVNDDREDEISEGLEQHGSGIAGSLTFKYSNVLPGANMEVPVSFSHNISGQSAAGGFTRGQNADRLSVGAKLIYKTAWEATVNYTAYFGSPEDNQYTDRDFASLNLKYSF